MGRESVRGGYQELTDGRFEVKRQRIKKAEQYEEQKWEYERNA